MVSSGSDCKNRWCPDTQQRPKAHLPFRDRASQLNMRPHKRSPVGSAAVAGATDQNTQPEPEPEEAALDECGGGDVMLPVEEADESDEDALPNPITEEDLPEAPAPMDYPTLEEYKARWAERLAAHSKGQATKSFSLSTLVPKPLPALWQDCLSLSTTTSCDFMLFPAFFVCCIDGVKVLTSLSTISAAKKPNRDYASVDPCLRFSRPP